MLAENLADQTYNFRLPGLNTDFMSYTSLALAGNNRSALLDHNTLGNISSAVFSLFFKNFVQSNVRPNDALFMNGTWGLQPRGEVIPSNLGPTLSSNSTAFLQDSFPSSNTKPISQAIISTEILKLEMNPAVVIICLCISSLLAVFTIVIMVIHRRYLSALPRNVETLGSVLGFLYGSERLLKVANDSVGSCDKSAHGEMVQIGWFDAGGKRRWGIEIVRPGDQFFKEYLGEDKGSREVRLADGHERYDNLWDVG